MLCIYKSKSNTKVEMKFKSVVFYFNSVQNSEKIPTFAYVFANTIILHHIGIHLFPSAYPLLNANIL